MLGNRNITEMMTNNCSGSNLTLFCLVECQTRRYPSKSITFPTFLVIENLDKLHDMSHELQSFFFAKIRALQHVAHRVRQHRPI